MAKVTMLRNPAASFGCSLKEGESGELDLSLAEKLSAMGVAVIIEKPAVIKAVPEQPSMQAVESEPVEAQESQPEEPETKTENRRKRH